MRELTFYQLLYDEYGKHVIIDDFAWFCGLTQEDKVWWHLKKFGNITNLVCRTIYGIGHTPSVIKQLRNQSVRYGDNKYIITSEREKGKDRWGKKTSFVRYTLKEIKQ